MTTVFFDVDTQIDFLYPAGALYVPGAETIVPSIATLNRFAAVNGFAVISTMDAHAEDDPEFRSWPPHCVAGTLGQRKPACTLLERGAQQIFIEKQTFDCFSNPNLAPLLERLAPERCVVYGVATDICVKFAAFGLLRRGVRVEMVSDAVRGVDAAATERTLADFVAAGGHVVSANHVIAPPSF